MNKTIWMCWFQGEDAEMPRLNRVCIDRWKKLNTDWQVNILSKETISDYVPEYDDIVKNSPYRSLAAKSDLLRILLLSKFGGVWADASLYPMLPLEDFIPDIINDVGFFTYRFMRRSLSKRGNRETVSWFLCVDRANHPLINLWKKAFVDKFQNLKKWKYFAFHEALCELYDNDNQVKFIIDNMIQISEAIPHSAVRDWKKRKNSYVYKRPNLFLKKPIAEKNAKDIVKMMYEFSE